MDLLHHQQVLRVAPAAAVAEALKLLCLLILLMRPAAGLLSGLLPLLLLCELLLPFPALQPQRLLLQPLMSPAAPAPG
jgi:hypothetical protein